MQISCIPICFTIRGFREHSDIRSNVEQTQAITKFGQRLIVDTPKTNLHRKVISGFGDEMCGQHETHYLSVIRSFYLFLLKKRDLTWNQGRKGDMSENPPDNMHAVFTALCKSPA
jgi:hypothetical protein